MSKTVNIPDAMHANVRIMAALKGTRMSAEIQDAISLHLAAHRKLCRNGGRLPKGKSK